MAYSKTYTTTFPASINRGWFVVVPPANPWFPNSNSFRSLQTSRISLLRCNITGDSGESGCKAMLDAFFFGKIIGETLCERIESSVGVIGILQSDQLKHVTQFQEEVLEKARRAKEEAMQLGLASIVKEEADELISEATEKATEEARRDISSVAPSIVSKASSSLLDRATQNPFNKD
ncbi:hypothetical protein AAHA92_18307 [Salvia divinorum]|uniref:Uncharacterized protein n=1 Tax=Salvia divinorum TaxID=28513 RepID=A0ABD1H1N4_SALDI